MEVLEYYIVGHILLFESKSQYLNAKTRQNVFIFKMELNLNITS